MKNLWNSKYEPMLLSEIEKPFDSKDFIFEVKFDGIRCLIYVSPKTIKIISRNQKDLTHLFPELNILKTYVKEKTIFDGEIICMDKNLPSFSKIQKRLHLKNTNKIVSQIEENPVLFVCFDIIFQNTDLTHIPLIKRKKILSNYHNNDYFYVINYVENNGINLFKHIKKMGLEGIVAKKIDSEYEINTRSSNWIKIKNYQEEKFYIGGYSYKEDTYVFSVLLGEIKNKNLIFVGKVFIKKSNNIFNKLKKEKVIKNPFNNYNESKYTYVIPKYQCTIRYIERTKNNNLRQPFFVGDENE